ncbi:MAG: primosomal protein N', partial [Spirochaetaceae bacterium]|nr:primosomal protein N' [Spirochaetaceae bacterium]
TEFIEEEVKNLFPGFTIDRIDTDNLTDKNALQEKIAAFKQGKIDILLGTQMVAKGLNFPGLKLVGVISADTGLHLPDFRASERTFSLILQVAGRAGRFFPDGKVIVQSFNPYHPAISCACKNDVEGFYKSEIENRSILYFPPFCRMVRIVFRSANEIASKTSAESFAKFLQSYNQDNKFEILGPSECALKKIALNYRYQILLRGDSLNILQKTVSMIMCNYKTAANVYIEIDIDPVSLL